MKRSAPIVVPLLLAFTAVPWVLYLRGHPQSETVRVVRAEAATVPAPEASPSKPDGPPQIGADLQARERPAADPLDLQALAMKFAAEEAAKIAGYEAALAAMADRLPLAESYKVGRRWGELADLAESALRSQPVIQLHLLDPAWLRHRSNLLSCRFAVLLREAQLALIDAAPVASQEEQDIRNGLRLKWTNESREFRRQIEELGLRREPERRAARPEVYSSAEGIERESALRTTQTTRVTCDFTNRPIGDVVAFLREYSGMNIVVRGAESVSPVTVTLRDVTLDGVLDHLAEAAGLTWSVDRFGILTLSPKK